MKKLVLLAAVFTMMSLPFANPVSASVRGVLPGGVISHEDEPTTNAPAPAPEPSKPEPTKPEGE